MSKYLGLDGNRYRTKKEVIIADLEHAGSLQTSDFHMRYGQRMNFSAEKLRANKLLSLSGRKIVQDGKREFWRIADTNPRPRTVRIKRRLIPVHCEINSASQKPAIADLLGGVIRDIQVVQDMLKSVDDGRC